MEKKNVSIGECSSGLTPSLNVVKLNFGYDTIESVIKQWLLSSVAFLSKEPFSDYQISELVNILINKGGAIKLAEMAIFFNKFKSGDYGQIYGDLKPSDITVAFNEFMKDRFLSIDKYQRDQDRINRENSRYVNESSESNGELIRAKISYAAYEEIKRKINEQKQKEDGQI